MYGRRTVLEDKMKTYTEKNFGSRIHNLYGLRAAVKMRMSVICKKPHDRSWLRPRPAAFMINLSGAILIHLFDNGMYLFKK